ncbi:cytochrome b [Thalassotalea sp. G2M2-11]|uniref:cytochrome b n=1 Tax=Thalassotalea sp. G2M2-11 TaxID=2787627 RepID=UPI0019D1DDC8|nr:cytochrome b [Thalassotalea sp. G2M2-11]
MSSDNQLHKYSPSLRTLHWLMFVLIALTFIFIEFRSLFDKGTDERELMKLIHFTLGFSVFILMLVRFIVRSQSTNKKAISTVHPKVAAYIHLAFYGLFLLMPILGWLTLNAEGKDLVFLGLELPALINPNESLAELFEETHETIGKILYLLITLHVLGALFHHFVKKDQTINKMTS